MSLSFSAEIKQEITQETPLGSAGSAALCALLLIRGSLHIHQSMMYVDFQTKNAATAKYVFRILRQNYDASIELAVLRSMNIKKNIYRLRVAGAGPILEDLTILRQGTLCSVPSYKLVRSDRNARAFLQGCFLASGSVNSPRTTNYHLEIAVPDQELADLVIRLLERFGIQARCAARKKEFLVYIKQGEKIGDFLRLAGAGTSLMQFENIRIERDFYNQITRLDNCELANEMKTLKAAREQLEWIEIVELTGMEVPEKVLRVMEARKANPEASSVELCEVVKDMYGETITKSGMKHRLARLKELAGKKQPAEKGK